MKQEMVMADVLSAQALYDGTDADEVLRRARQLCQAPEATAGAGTDGADGLDEEATFYDQYVTAALDQPDYLREDELGDYDTLEGIDGGGRAAIDEAEEEDEEMARETAAQRELLQNMEGYEQMQRRLVYRCKDPALGEPYGTNEAGGQLRIYDGRVFLVCQDDDYADPPPAKTARAALRQQAARRWHVLGRRNMHVPPSRKPPPLVSSADLAAAAAAASGGPRASASSANAGTRPTRETGPASSVPRRRIKGAARAGSVFSHSRQLQQRSSTTTTTSQPPTTAPSHR